MTLEEIKSLEHITVLEGEYNLTITPDFDYYVEVEDTPVNQIYYDSFEILIQPEYSQMWVKSLIPDTSINDASL